MKMLTTLSKSKLAAQVVCLVALTTFCANDESAGPGASAGETPTTSSSQDSASEDSAQDDHSNVEDENEDIPPSPLLEYVDLLPVSGSSSKDFLQDGVIACMSEQGFEWQPPPDTAGFAGELGEVVEGDPMDREWASVYGFGISTSAFRQEDVGPDLVGSSQDSMSPSSDASPTGEAADDLNDPYVDSLTPEARTAYFDSLATCQQTMIDAQSGEQQNEAFVEEFGEEIAELYEQARQSPEVVAVEADMMICLSDAGFQHATFQDMTDSFALETQALSAEVSSPSGPSEGGEGSSSGPVGAAPLNEDQRARLADIQGREVQAALAAIDCNASQEQIWQAVDRAFYDLQVQYIEDNRDRLDAFVLSQADDG